MHKNEQPTALGLKRGHDGGIAAVGDGQLLFSLEAEKDSHPRHSEVHATIVETALARLDREPDVIAVGGWHKLLPGLNDGEGGGYFGLEPGELRRSRVLGNTCWSYTNSHERSHIYGAVAMSPYDPEREIAVLVWEGVIGSLYVWRGARETIEQYQILDQPGARYAALFCVAEPTFADTGKFPPTEYAGKQMALAGFADNLRPTDDSVDVVESILKLKALYPFDKYRYRRSELYNVGVTSPEFCRAARYLSDRLFDLYWNAAREIYRQRTPLVISGGCGLNCEWNSAWRSSGLFEDVFVPPVCDDSGSAVGTAIDAAVQLGAPCHIDWTVYSGEEFVVDRAPESSRWAKVPFDYAHLANLLNTGAVLAWVDGRYEIGPRALGHRSLLADARSRTSRARLNGIKHREAYRPIAPICLADRLDEWFDDGRSDPYMLSLRRVRDPNRVPAIAHANNTARVQSVTREANEHIYALLEANLQASGVPMLCNTSLNFSGRGFVNRLSELEHLCETTGIEVMVVNRQTYVATTDGNYDA